MRKADVEYYSFCVRAERARLEWETAVTRGSHCLQALEEERLQQMGALAATHLAHLAQLGPQLLQVLYFLYLDHIDFLYIFTFIQIFS